MSIKMIIVQFIGVISCICVLGLVVGWGVCVYRYTSDKGDLTIMTQLITGINGLANNAIGYMAGALTPGIVNALNNARSKDERSSDGTEIATSGALGGDLNESNGVDSSNTSSGSISGNSVAVPVPNPIGSKGSVKEVVKPAIDASGTTSGTANSANSANSASGTN